MRTIDCPTEMARENEINHFKKHGGRNKVLVQQGETTLVTDNAMNNPGGTLLASSDANGRVQVIE